MTFDVASIQPFTYSDSGGGSRIIRAMMEVDHPPTLFIDTGLESGPARRLNDDQIRVPLRGHFGRLESSRLGPVVTAWDPLFLCSFERRLEAALLKYKVRVAHLIPHTFEFASTWSICRKLGLPVVLSVHDDLLYAIASHPHKNATVRGLATAWREAEARLVISDELAEEYNRRFGARSYALVTDGIEQVKSRPALQGSEKKLSVYFMGLFHYNYSDNFRVLIEALEKIRASHPKLEVELICRCGSIPFDTSKATIRISVLPFEKEAIVERDMNSVTMVYQPLSFDSKAEALGRFSLSTKMITYLGSGVPIVFHGPAGSAACNLLQTANAAAVCTSLDAGELTDAIDSAVKNSETLLAHAKTLAFNNFMLQDQQKRFWAPILDALR